MDNPKGGSDLKPHGEATDDTSTPQLPEPPMLNEAASASAMPPISPAESSPHSTEAIPTRNPLNASVAADSDLAVGNEAIDIILQAHHGNNAVTSHVLNPLESPLYGENLSNNDREETHSVRDSVSGEMVALCASPSDVGPRLSPPPEAIFETENTTKSVSQEVPLDAAFSELEFDDRDVVSPTVVVSSLVSTISLSGLKEQLQTAGPSAQVPCDDFLTSVLLVSSEDINVAAAVTSLLGDRAQELQRPLSSSEEPQPVPVVGQTTVDVSMSEWLKRTSHEAQPSDQLVRCCLSFLHVCLEGNRACSLNYHVAHTSMLCKRPLLTFFLVSIFLLLNTGNYRLE